MSLIREIPVKTYVAKSKIPGVDFVINPYVGCTHGCVYCYAEYMRKFSGHEEPWGQFLDVKTCPVPLKPAQLFRQRVLLSSVTDPYNPHEATFQRTRQLLQQLHYCQARVFILTKSALVLRDLDILKQLAESEVCFSFSSADDEVRQRAEPGASSVQQKIEALNTLHAHGIKTAVMAAPLLPGISDWQAIVQATRPYTLRYSFDSLNMRPAYQRNVVEFVGRFYPDLLPLYTRIYIEEDTTYWTNLAQEITSYCARENIPADVYFPHQ